MFIDNKITTLSVISPIRKCVNSTTSSKKQLQYHVLNCYTVNDSVLLVGPISLQKRAVSSVKHLHFIFPITSYLDPKIQTCNILVQLRAQIPCNKCCRCMAAKYRTRWTHKHRSCEAVIRRGWQGFVMNVIFRLFHIHSNMSLSNLNRI